jgi:hypothetical protein
MEWNDITKEIAEILDKVYGLSFEQHKDVAQRFRSKKAMELIERIQFFVNKKIKDKEDKINFELKSKKEKMEKAVKEKRKHLLEKNKPF